MIIKPFNTVFLLIMVFVLSSSKSLGSDTIRFTNSDINEIPELAYILCMHQDSEGYMWFGTYNGLIRYNGTKYTVYNYSKEKHTLSNPVVHAIAEDKDGNLWLGTENGLNKFIRKKSIFTSYLSSGKDSKSLSSTHIRAIHIDKDGIVWLGTRGGGLNKFNPVLNQFTHYLPENCPSSLTNLNINCLTAENDSILWVGTENGGLCKFNMHSGKFKHSIRRNAEIIGCVFIDKNSTIWVGTWYNGLFKKGINDSLFIPVPLLNKSNWTVKDIKEDADGKLWIGTYGDGLLVYDKKENNYKKYVSNPELEATLANNSIWSIFVDNSQIIYIATFGNGFSKYDKYTAKFNFVKTNKENKQNIKIGNIRGIAKDKEGIWFASDNGLYKYNKIKNEYTKFTIDASKSQDYNYVFTDSRGYLWIGIYEIGLIQYDISNSQYRYYFNKELFPEFLDYNYVTVIKEDNENNIWFAVYEGGLFKIPKSQIDISQNERPQVESFIKLPESPVIPSNIIWDIHFDTNNDTWFATSTCIGKLDKDKRTSEVYENIAHSVIYSDRPGILWVGSLGMGLGKLDMSTKKITYYSSNKGLVSDIVQGISGDQDGNIWLSTQKGISKFNPITETFKNYDSSDGVDSKHFNINSNIKLSSGEIIFGGTSGYTLFQPNTIQDNPYTPKVVISDIKIFNKSIIEGYSDTITNKHDLTIVNAKEIVLDSDDKMLTINFFALCFSSPENIKYAYKLDGFEQNWNFTQATNTLATYTNLEGGEYLFKVKAANADGVWSEEITELQITVELPIWAKLSFKVMIVLIVFMMITLGIFINYARLKNRHKYEITRLKNDKLDSELEQKNKELISKTLTLLHKNEKIKELKTKANEVLHKISASSQPKIYSLIKFIQKELENDQFWDQFEHEFNLSHSNFLKRFKEEYDLITHKELKICAYIRMNLSNQEIATLLNITYRGVEATRYRIRKKIHLNRDIRLNDFILKY